MRETDVAPAPLGSNRRSFPREDGRPRRPETPSRPRALPVATVSVLVLGLLVTATLTLVTRTVHNHNENRLLRQRGAEVAAVLSAAIPSIQTPLVSAALVAEATDADRRDVTGLLSPLVTSKRFVSTSIWPAAASDPRPLEQFGVQPELARLPAAARRSVLSRATTPEPKLIVVDLLGSADRRLGYAYAVGAQAKYVIYVESALPPNRRSRVDSNSAFADIDYAIYLGPDKTPRNLIAASVIDPDFRGRTASDKVPFGDHVLKIVLTPHGELGGALLPRLPWIIAVVGTLITLAAALLIDRLVRRRAHAEELAQENARLFREQRSVARTLQHSLLPEKLPEIPGLDLAVRYVPGVDGVDIGGDWYDVIVQDDHRVIFVVGDVSGRGLRAAAVMASLRYAIHAYAAEGDAPATILDKLGKLLSVSRDGHFATVLCGVVDVAAHRLTTANAGHPNPLVVTGDGAEFVATVVGPPIGVDAGPYTVVDTTLPPGATLLAYTDGLYERRTEHPDVGLARLREATRGDASLDTLLDAMLEKMTPGGGHDDTAILGIRWWN